MMGPARVHCDVQMLIAITVAMSPYPCRLTQHPTSSSSLAAAGHADTDTNRSRRSPLGATIDPIQALARPLIARHPPSLVAAGRVGSS
ncbi:hypothetical protein VTO73DRAFT_9570 [Trametes versicolor]